MIDITNYENLANAIVMQTAKDYIHAIRTVKRRKNTVELLQETLEIEAFFHSPWHGTLTTLDPDVLIIRMRKETVK